MRRLSIRLYILFKTQRSRTSKILITSYESTQNPLPHSTDSVLSLSMVGTTLLFHQMDRYERDGFFFNTYGSNNQIFLR